jgi:hypothetical protein
MDQKYEFLAKIFFLLKWIFIVAFDIISLVLNVFIEIIYPVYQTAVKESHPNFFFDAFSQMFRIDGCKF